MATSRDGCDSFIELLDPRNCDQELAFPDHESCVIDGILFNSFLTAEDQLTFSRLSAGELDDIPVSILPVVPNDTEQEVSHILMNEELVRVTPEDGADILFIDCGFSDLKDNTVMTRRERNICSLCGQMFAFEFSLEYHLRSIVPPNSKKLYCEFCPHISLSGETMRMHNKHLHGKRLYDMYQGADFLKELSVSVPPCKPCF